MVSLGQMNPEQTSVHTIFAVTRVCVCVCATWDAAVYLSLNFRVCSWNALNLEPEYIRLPNPLVMAHPLNNECAASVSFNLFAPTLRKGKNKQWLVNKLFFTVNIDAFHWMIFFLNASFMEKIPLHQDRHHPSVDSAE